jgi:two-component system LytT family response regulator
MAQSAIEVLLLDDEPDSLVLSRQAIARYTLMKSIHCAQTVEEALQILQAHPVQLAFLDVELSHSSGFALCEHMHRQYPSVAVVILTGHVDLGAKSYDYEPFDFLTKPVDVLRMERTFERFSERQAAAHSPRIMIETNAGFVLLNPNDICYIVKNGSTCEVHCLRGEQYRVTYTLDRLEAMLANYNFFRTHQSFLVPVARILQVKGTKFGNTYEARLDDGTTVPVSRNQYAKLKESMMMQCMRVL